MFRASVERRRTLRVWRSHLFFVHNNAPPDCTCEFQPGRFRKGERIAGCGSTRCYLCHAGKLTKRPTPQQFRSDLSYREWRLNLGLSTPRLRRPD